jgi:hypothetical protein
MRALSLLLLVPAALTAQMMRARDLAAPLRVRSTIPELSSTPYVGKVQAADSSRLVLALTDYGTGLSIPWSSATRIERSMGHDRGNSAARGLIVGAAAGAAMYATQIGYARRGAEPGWNVVGLQALSFIIIPGTGALIGMASARERWETVSEIPRAGGGPIGFVLASSDELKLTTDRGVVRGRVASVANDSVFLGNSRVAWSDVTGAQIRGGRNRWQGALWGGAGLLGIAVYSEIRDPALAPRERPGAFAANAALGAIIGGLFLGGKGWVSIPVRSVRPISLQQ